MVVSVSSPNGNRLLPAVIGGVALWLLLSVGSALSATLFPSSADAASALARPALWYVATLAVSLVVGAVLLLAQERLPDQRLRSAVSVGIALGLIGTLGLLAAGINSGAVALAVFRAVLLLSGVIGASMLVFATRGRTAAR